MKKKFLESYLKIAACISTSKTKQHLEVCNKMIDLLYKSTPGDNTILFEALNKLILTRLSLVK